MVARDQTGPGPRDVVEPLEVEREVRAGQREDGPSRGREPRLGQGSALRPVQGDRHHVVAPPSVDGAVRLAHRLRYPDIGARPRPARAVPRELEVTPGGVPDADRARRAHPGDARGRPGRHHGDAGLGDVGPVARRGGARDRGDPRRAGGDRGARPARGRDRAGRGRGRRRGARDARRAAARPAAADARPRSRGRSTPSARSSSRRAPTAAGRTCSSGVRPARSTRTSAPTRSAVIWRTPPSATCRPRSWRRASSPPTSTSPAISSPCSPTAAARARAPCSGRWTPGRGSPTTPPPAEEETCRARSRSSTARPGPARC